MVTRRIAAFLALSVGGIELVRAAQISLKSQDKLVMTQSEQTYGAAEVYDARDYSQPVSDDELECLLNHLRNKKGWTGGIVHLDESDEDYDDNNTDTQV